MKKTIVYPVDGLPVKNPTAPIVLTFDDEHFIIEEMGMKGFKAVVVKTFKIPIVRINDTMLTTEKELIEQSKSVIGRGVAGGLLFGPAGLFLGGLSGVGKKQKKKISHFYVISYNSSEGTIKNITFSLPEVSFKNVSNFDGSLKLLLDVSSGSSSESDEIYL